MPDQTIELNEDTLVLVKNANPIALTSGLLFIQDTQPDVDASLPYLWVQTGTGTGTGFTLWVNKGS